MENWTKNTDIITILNYLGYTECTTADKIKWLNCKTVERLERTPLEHQPLYHTDRKEPIFINSLSILLDWDKLIQISIELGIENISTNKYISMKVLAKKIIEFNSLNF